MAKILDKFPFKDQTLADLKVLDPRNRMEATPASIIRLCQRFYKCTPLELDDILGEVNDYRIMPQSQLPGALGQFWFSMGCIQKPGDTSEKRFGNLSLLSKTATSLKCRPRTIV